MSTMGGSLVMLLFLSFLPQQTVCRTHATAVGDFASGYIHQTETARPHRNFYNPGAIMGIGLASVGRRSRNAEPPLLKLEDFPATPKQLQRRTHPSPSYERSSEDEIEVLKPQDRSSMEGTSKGHAESSLTSSPLHSPNEAGPSQYKTFRSSFGLKPMRTTPVEQPQSLFPFVLRPRKGHRQIQYQALNEMELANRKPYDPGEVHKYRQALPPLISHPSTKKIRDAEMASAKKCWFIGGCIVGASVAGTAAGWGGYYHGYRKAYRNAVLQGYITGFEKQIGLDTAETDVTVMNRHRQLAHAAEHMRLPAGTVGRPEPSAPKPSPDEADRAAERKEKQ